MINKRFAFRSVSIAASAGAAVLLIASAPIIGMTSGQSGVTLDNARVSGTATIFDGSTVQSEGYSRIHLNNGTRLDFAAGSKAQLFAGHAALASGMTEMQSPAGFEIDTKLLKIRPSGADSIARVRIDGGKVYVTALNSPVSVMNTSGLLVAKVAPGVPMAFMPQGASAPNSFKGTGCVIVKDHKAYLSDDNTKVFSELTGPNLRNSIGNQVEIVGTVDPTATPVGGATQVVNVSSTTVKRRGGCTAVAALLGGSVAPAGLGGAAGAGGAAAGAATGAGVGSTVLIVGGIAAAAAAGVGGAAAAGAFSTPSP